MTSEKRLYPLSLEQQKQLADQLEQAEKTVGRHERMIRRLRHDQESLGSMYENAINLKQHSEREKDKQYMYNKLLLKVFPGIIFVLDAELKYIIGTDAQILRLFDFSDERELIALPLQSILTGSLDDDWVQKTLDTCADAMRRSATVQYTDFLHFRGGARMHVNVTITPVTDEHDATQGLLLVLDDVSELVEMKERAEAAAEAKSSFLANMSHELRTPMNAILGMGHLLDKTGLQEKQQGYLDNMLRASDSLLEVINDILDFSKIDARRIELAEREYKLMDLIGDVVNIIRLKANGKRLAFTTDIDPHLAASYYGDNVRIKQILVNILSNALKYTKVGGFELRVTHGTRNGRDCLHFVVQDTGIGIKPEDTQNLFTAFTQVDTKRNRGIEGTGLGLAISKGLALAMKGDITVESEYGSGSRFTLSVPQVVMDATPLVRMDETGKDARNILLCGQGVVANSVACMLGAMGLKHTVLPSGENLLDETQRHDYTHLILSNKDDIDRIKHHPEIVRSAKVVVVLGLGHANDGEWPIQATLLYTPVLVTSLAEALGGTVSNTAGETGKTSDALGKFSAPDAVVLIADDNEINLLVAEEILRQYEIQVVAAPGGAEALSETGKRKFDLVLMDHMMPGMDGVEATRQIRESGGRNALVPIIALTANAVSGMREYYLNNRMDDYLSKPIDIDQLNDKLLRWLPPEKIRLK